MKTVKNFLGPELPPADITSERIIRILLYLTVFTGFAMLMIVLYFNLVQP